MSEVAAYHEAGHAFVAVYLGGRVRSVTIEPDWDDGPERYGDAQIIWNSGSMTARALCENSLCVALAGPVAEMIHSGEPYHPGLVPEWTGDWQTAWDAAATLYPDERRRLKYLEKMTGLIYQTLSRDDHWAALAAIVDHLLAHETLEGEQVDEILAYFRS